MGFGILCLGAAVAAFLKANPAVTLDMHLDDRFVNLVAEGMDVAIRIGRLTDSSLVARKIATSQPIVVAAPAYLEERGEPQAPEDLAAHNCLLYSYLSTANVWRFTTRDGAELPVAVTGTARVNNGNLECEMAAEGLGLAMVPAFYATAYLRSGRLRRVLKDHRMPELGIYAVYPQRAHVPPKVKAFVDFLVERFARRAQWERA